MPILTTERPPHPDDRLADWYRKGGHKLDRAQPTTDAEREILDEIRRREIADAGELRAIFNHYDHALAALHHYGIEIDGEDE